MQKEYKIYSSRLFEKQIKKVPNAIKTVVETWITSIELKGGSETRQIYGYHDEPL